MRMVRRSSSMRSARRRRHLIFFHSLPSCLASASGMQVDAWVADLADLFHAFPIGNGAASSSSSRRIGSPRTSAPRARTSDRSVASQRRDGTPMPPGSANVPGDAWTHRRVSRVRPADFELLRPAGGIEAVSHDVATFARCAGPRPRTPRGAHRRADPESRSGGSSRQEFGRSGSVQVRRVESRMFGAEPREGTHMPDRRIRRRGEGRLARDRRAAAGAFPGRSGRDDVVAAGRLRADDVPSPAKVRNFVPVLIEKEAKARLKGKR